MKPHRMEHVQPWPKKSIRTRPCAKLLTFAPKRGLKTPFLCYNGKNNIPYRRCLSVYRAIIGTKSDAIEKIQCQMLVGKERVVFSISTEL